MCGIFAILGLPENTAQDFRKTAVALSRRQRHRGPDWSGCVVWKDCILCHERLAIIDLENGAQPIRNEGSTVALCVNGEIYNYKALGDELKEYHFRTESDCECLMHLYEKHGERFLEKVPIYGMFAFVLYDRENDNWIAARDHAGICPLYMGTGLDGSFWFSSELKALMDNHCVSIQQFPPGRFLTKEMTKNGNLKKWKEQGTIGDLTAEERKEGGYFYQPQWLSKVDYVPTGTADLDLSLLRENFEAAVVSHMMSDTMFGVLLSGGLDSSLVASIAARNLKNAAVDRDLVTRMQSFCIGLEESPDLKAAKKVADYIGSKHRSWVYTVDEGIDSLEDVIQHIETYDVTTVRASTPMYLLSRRIKASGVKMVLSGEGADEIFGGYLYFHKAPNREEFQAESVRKVSQLYMYDCLRANKSMMAWGVEVRVPFLDRKFMDYAMTIDPQHKMVDKEAGKLEKYILRKAFDVNDENGDPVYLPKEVLWRQKEQFSDGVGYNWIDSLQAYADRTVSDQQLNTAAFRFSKNTPLTKEAYLYREIFERLFPGDNASETVPGGPSIACSTAAAIKWDASFANRADPSGRAIAGVHDDAYTG